MSAVAQDEHLPAAMKQSLHAWRVQSRQASSRTVFTLPRSSQRHLFSFLTRSSWKAAICHSQANNMEKEMTPSQPRLAHAALPSLPPTTAPAAPCGSEDAAMGQVRSHGGKLCCQSATCATCKRPLALFMLALLTQSQPSPVQAPHALSSASPASSTPGTQHENGCTGESARRPRLQLHGLAAPLLSSPAV